MACHAIIVAADNLLAGIVAAAVVPAAQVERVSPPGVRDQFLKRLRRTTRGVELVNEAGEGISLIALDAHLIELASSTTSRRTQDSGVNLLLWLRKDLRLTTPVVLWSFLDFDSLRAKHPILTLTEGLTFVRLPASLAQLQAAFEQALSPGNALSAETMDQELARLYPSAGGGSQVPAEMGERVGALASSSRSLDGPLSDALNALASGSADELLGALDGSDWHDFTRKAGELEKELRRERLQVAELVEVGKRARGLSSFAQWHGAAERSAQELTEAARYYADCAAILRVNVAALACAVDAEAE